jgi:MFS family permease
MIATNFALWFVPQVYADHNVLIKERFRIIGSDLRSLLQSPAAVFTMIVIILPIGIGAATNLWSSVANDWHVKADTVALVTGTLSAVASAGGSVAGGWISDRSGRWLAYFGAGALMAAITLGMTFFVYQPAPYITGVLLYAVTYGMANAAFSAIVLNAIGKGMASTKYALLSSLGNIPYPYMTMIDGWLHDVYGIRMMLLGETLLGISFMIIMIVVLTQMRSKKIAV